MKLLRTLVRHMTGRVEVCTDPREHGPHRDCAGLTDAPCERNRSLLDWHRAHWTAPRRLCRGSGLLAICPHGRAALDACDEC
jgi:hypothetical protein